MFGLFGGKTFAPKTDIPDLAGKVILVTGGNTGLGLESVRQLALHNPSRIFLAARTPSKGEAAVADIKKETPSANVTFLPLDLSSFQSISAAAKEFTSQSQRLDILINNAGIMAVPPGFTAEGFEIQLGTNHIGHALLTKLLLPTLLATAKEPNSNVRIVNLTSEGHNFARSADVLLDKSKLEAQNTWARYGYSKLANILFAHELAKRYPSITSVAVHPGIIKTDLYLPNQQSSAIMRCGLKLSDILLPRGTVPTGALNQLWAATGEREDVVNGSYYKPVAILSKGSPCAQNEKLATDLWEWTEKEIEGKGY